jgi:hypothetical protein
MWVKVTIPEIINRAACTTHDKCSSTEDSNLTEDGREWCDWRDERCGKKCAEKTWEEEVISACRLVQANEFCVWDHGLR